MKPRDLKQHSASANSESSYSGSADESSYSESSDESSEESTRIIPDPPMSWYPPGSLPSTSSSTGSTHDTTAVPKISPHEAAHHNNFVTLLILVNLFKMFMMFMVTPPTRFLCLSSLCHSSRGPTLMHGSDWNPSGGILHIVPNELNQVVDGYTPLASRLGVLARDGNLMPLTYRTWSHVTKENKERIWREVKVNTDADESMKKFVLASVGKKWREWKARVKQMGYTPFDNDADRHRKKETNKKNGVPATCLEVWMAGYSKDNKPSTDKVVAVMTQMKELRAQSNATDEEIITQVLGPERPSQVRTYGLGPSSTDEIMDAMLNQQKVQMDMQSTIQAQQERIEQLESQQAMGGPVAPASTHVHSQQQSYAYTSSFNFHRSPIKERKEEKEEEEEEEEVDRANSMKEGRWSLLNSRLVGSH
ncbi:unnamed protein product [Camellia sinensis]